VAHPGKLMLGIVSAGTLIGLLLGSFANPVMKPGPASPLGQEVASVGYATASSPYIEALPEDLTPPTVREGYAPAIAFTELPEIWSADFPAPRFFQPEDESFATWAEWRDQPAKPAPDNSRIEVTSGTTTEFVQVAEAAVAADAALEDVAEATPPIGDSAPPETRLSALY
jgi:hypothetical protein